MPPDCTLGVPLVKIVGAEFLIGEAIAHDVVGDFENVVADGDDCLLVAAMPFDSVVPSLERRPVAARSRQASLDQGAAQIAVPLPRLPAAPLAGTLVLTRTHGPPTTQVPSGGKATQCRLPFQPRC